MKVKAANDNKSSRITRLARKAMDAFTNPNGNGHGEREDHAVLAPISPEQIRLRAYELFLARDGSHGNDWRDWFLAERELAGKDGA